MKPNHPSLRSQSHQGGGGKIDSAQLTVPQFHGGQSRQNGNVITRGKLGKPSALQAAEALAATDENYPTTVLHQTGPPVMIFSNSN